MMIELDGIIMSKNVKSFAHSSQNVENEHIIISRYSVQ